jgi:hypothetical protein
MKGASSSVSIVWLAALGFLLPACTAPIDADPPRDVAAKSIFNGVDLTGWDGDPRFWRVEDGTLTGETTAARPLEHNTFIIYREAEVTDFEIQFEYVIRSDWANSGLQYRSFEVLGAGPGDRWIVGGYQADIDAPVQYTGILYGERERGILALRGQRVEIEPGGTPRVIGSLGDSNALARHINSKDGWNAYRIVVSGNHATHEINGVMMAEIVDNDAIAAEPGAKGARMHGLLALQLHTGQPMKIQFRNITLRALAR